MKVKLTPETIFKFPHYESIKNLLFEFTGKSGLQQKHFRYALIENHDNMEWYNERKVKEDFMDKDGKDKLQPLIDSEKINPKCISSGKNLTNFLNRLVDMEIIKKVDRGKITKYRLEETYLLEEYKIRNKEMIDLYERDEIHPVNIDSSFRNHILYGFPSKVYKSKRVEIKKKVKGIDELLSEIDSICFDELWDKWKEKYVYLLDEYGNKAFRDFMEDKYDAFFDMVFAYCGDYLDEKHLEALGIDVSKEDNNLILEDIDTYLPYYIADTFKISIENAKKFWEKSYTEIWNIFAYMEEMPYISFSSYR